MVMNPEPRIIRSLDMPAPTEGERRAAAEAKRLARLREVFPERALGFALRVDESSSAAIAKLHEWAGGGGAGAGGDRREGIVVLAGATGCGKTVAAAWLAVQRSAQSFAFEPTFLRASELATMSRYDAEARARWHRPRWLLLDDLGAEYLDAKGSFRADLDELVDVYYAEGRTLIVTTNCTAEEFRARYGARVVDRLRECGTWIAIAGGSLRGKGEPR